MAAAFAANEALQKAEAAGRHIRTKIVTLGAELAAGEPVPPAHLAQRRINKSKSEGLETNLTKETVLWRLPGGTEFESSNGQLFRKTGETMMGRVFGRNNQVARGRMLAFPVQKAAGSDLRCLLHAHWGEIMVAWIPSSFG
jgi:hypothetical protein